MSRFEQLQFPFLGLSVAQCETFWQWHLSGTICNSFSSPRPEGKEKRGAWSLHLTLRYTAHCGSNCDGFASFQKENRYTHTHTHTHTHTEEQMVMMCLDEEIRYCFSCLDQWWLNELNVISKCGWELNGINLPVDFRPYSHKIHFSTDVLLGQFLAFKPRGCLV
jgi:hypothetical protein